MNGKVDCRNVNLLHCQKVFILLNAVKWSSCKQSLHFEIPGLNCDISSVIDSQTLSYEYLFYLCFILDLQWHQLCLKKSPIPFLVLSVLNNLKSQKLCNVCIPIVRSALQNW